MRDPFVFARGYEEVIACADAGIPVTVVPGVTSAIAVPALAGVPVTHRAVTHEFVVVSGHIAPDHPESLVNWDALAAMSGTIVLLMAVERIEVNVPLEDARFAMPGQAGPSGPTCILVARC